MRLEEKLIQLKLLKDKIRELEAQIEQHSLPREATFNLLDEDFTQKWEETLNLAKQRYELKVELSRTEEKYKTVKTELEGYFRKLDFAGLKRLTFIIDNAKIVCDGGEIEIKYE